MNPFKVAAIFVIVWALATIAFVTFSDPIKDMAESTLLLNLDSGHGSGVHIGNGYIVTAAHVAVGNITAVDTNGREYKTELLFRNVNYDIALLKVNGDSLINAAFLDCGYYPVDTKIRTEGYPMGFGYQKTHGRISGGVRSNSGQWKESYIINGTILKGMSGGPAFLEDSNSFIGVNVGTYQGILGTVVPSPVVCKLMGRE